MYYTATEELIQLLSEITSRNKGANHVSSYTNLYQEQDQIHEMKSAETLSPSRAGDHTEKVVKKEVVRKPDTMQRSKSNATKKSFFGHSSQILMQQSEWMNNEAVPLLILPLIEPSTMVLVAAELGRIKLMKKNVKNYHLLPSLLSVDCAVHNMQMEICIAAQKRCMTRLSQLRSSLPTSSSEDEEREDRSFNLRVSSHASALQIHSAKIIKVRRTT